jgi:hypothetical protein
MDQYERRAAAGELVVDAKATAERLRHELTVPDAGLPAARPYLSFGLILFFRHTGALDTLRVHSAPGEPLCHDG